MAKKGKGGGRDLREKGGPRDWGQRKERGDHHQKTEYEKLEGDLAVTRKKHYVGKKFVSDGEGETF